MSLRIETFSNRTGGNAFYKALAHPLSVEPARALIARLAARGPVALYDPLGGAEAFAALHPLDGLDLAGLYVQDIEEIGVQRLGQSGQPVTELPRCRAASLLVAAFDAERPVDHIRHLIPEGMAVETLDALKLPDGLLSDPKRYLNPLNFATNFVFFRDAGGHHTRLRTVNYWGGYGAEAPRLWCRLFGADGATLAEWEQPLGPPGATVEIDSREVRARFGLDDFEGQVFVHVIGAAGHDVVKYALDTYGEDDTVLSCTHDANAWPAEFYAGLPAPAEGETLVLWVQNSHPRPIGRGEIAVRRMGEAGDGARLGEAVPAFGSAKFDVGAALPELAWPAQIEIRAGKHLVRPRYEIRNRTGRLRISHPNVERTDLAPDKRLPDVAAQLGKGYILPAPILPVDDYASLVLPTPMATTQESLPVAVAFYDTAGTEIGYERLGNLPRDHAVTLDLGARIGPRLNGRSGHAELIYDFTQGGEGDGWLHALFRYEQRASGHAAETSFGAHVFNTVLTYGNEPQSYAGRPPGLSTRLFLRVGPAPVETFCCLIYPASTPWHAASDTALSLHDGDGRQVAEERVAIACGGSLLWRTHDVFDARALEAAGPRAYVVIRDTTCRLFGYHGLEHPGRSLSLDHMFGF